VWEVILARIRDRLETNRTPRLVLINPNTREIGRIVTTNAPLGLLYIASYVRGYNYPVAFVDADIDDLSYPQIKRRIVESGADVVGITMTTIQAPFGHKLIRRLKREFPEKIFVVGGAHPSSVREKIFEECPEIDISVVGEGEETTKEILDSLKNQTLLNDVKGICFKEKQKILFTGLRPFLDVDKLPLPAVGLALPLSRYNAYFPPNRAAKVFPVLGSRGCAYNCKFCGTNLVWGGQVRFRNPASIVNEVEWLHDSYGIQEVFFLDDVFNLKRSWLRDICKGLINKDLHKEMIFKGSFRANSKLVDRETFELLKQSNFWLVAFGVESGNQRILDRMNKKLKLEEIERAFTLAKGLGFSTLGSFMIGNLGEDRRAVMDTIEFAQKINPDYYDFPIATPLPGTEYEKEAREKGLIRITDYSKYGMGKAVCETEHLKLNELEDLRVTAFEQMLSYKRTYISRNYKEMDSNHGQCSLNIGEDDEIFLGEGWYGPEEIDDMTGRWMGDEGIVYLRNKGDVKSLLFELKTHKPDVSIEPLLLHIFIDENEVGQIELADNGWHRVMLEIDPNIPSKGYLKVGIASKHIWVPSDYFVNDDRRRLSVYVHRIGVE